MPVTENLHMVLLRLRDCSIDRTLWVDAICINQDDTEERARQVRSMAQIYAKANRVVVWLEEATAGSCQENGEAVTNGDRALQVLCRAATIGRRKARSGHKADQQTVLALLQRSWFRRIWVSSRGLTKLAQIC